MDIRALLVAVAETQGRNGGLLITEIWSAPMSEKVGDEDRLLDAGEGEREGEDAERAGWTSIAFKSDSMLVPIYSGFFVGVEYFSSLRIP